MHLDHDKWNFCYSFASASIAHEVPFMLSLSSSLSFQLKQGGNLATRYSFRLLAGVCEQLNDNEGLEGIESRIRHTYRQISG